MNSCIHNLFCIITVTENSQISVGCNDFSFETTEEPRCERNFERLGGFKPPVGRGYEEFEELWDPLTLLLNELPAEYSIILQMAIRNFRRPKNVPITFLL